MDKYLVFRLEKPLYEETHRDQTVVPCFELVKEFEINAMAAVNKSYDIEAHSEANAWASQYSKDHNLRTLVLKGSVFG